MFRGFGTNAWLCVLALSFVQLSCQPAPQAVAPPRANLEPGEIFWEKDVQLPASERIEADVSLFGVRAGTFKMELEKPCARTRADDIEVRAEMSTAGVVRFFKATDGVSFTTMGSSGARPTHSELTVRDGDSKRIYRAKLKPGGADTTIERTGNPTKRLKEQTPHREHPLDMPSAFVLLRHWRAEPGARGYFYVLLGRHLWRVDVRFRGEVLLEQPASPEPTQSAAKAIKIDGRAERVKLPEGEKASVRAFAMWLSTDARRVPLRVQGDASFGTVDFALKSHEAKASARSTHFEPRCSASEKEVANLTE